MTLSRDLTFRKQGSTFECFHCAEDDPGDFNEEDEVWYVSGEVKLTCRTCGLTNEIEEEL